MHENTKAKRGAPEKQEEIALYSPTSRTQN
jgi:hypothetical protein